MCKNLIEHNRVLLFLLQQRVAKKAARKHNVFFAYIISQKEEKTSEKKDKILCFPINLKLTYQKFGKSDQK